MTFVGRQMRSALADDACWVVDAIDDGSRREEGGEGGLVVGVVVWGKEGEEDEAVYETLWTFTK